MTKTLLITYFDPFGGETTNAAGEVCKALPAKVGDLTLVKVEIPTVFGKAAQCAIQKIQAVQPDYVIMLGQAGGRKEVTPEKVAINYIDARIADNENNQPGPQKIMESAPDGIFSNINLEKIISAMQAEGHNIKLSLSAGAFVCNDTFYRVAHYLQGTTTKFDFVHVPYLPSQAKEGIPSMPQEEIAKTLERFIELLING